MVARSTTEEHRASTPLELFFDLCFVVAVSQAATQLHHELGEGHLGSGILFGTAAAVGAGLEGAIAQATGEAPHLSSRDAGLGVAVPLALYLVSLWVLHVLPVYRGAAARSVHPIGAALILVAPLAGLPVLAIGLLAMALLATWLLMSPTPALPDNLHDRP